MSGSTKVNAYKVMNQLRKEEDKPKLKALLDVVFDSRFKSDRVEMVTRHQE